MNKPFDGFAIKKQGLLLVRDFGGYETRNESTQKLLAAAVSEFHVPDFDWIFVNTGDQSIPSVGQVPIFSYCTNTGAFETCCPDFVFDHWRTTGLEDYEATRRWLRAFDADPQNDALGWRGADTHPSRQLFISRCVDGSFDCSFIEWDRTDPNKLTAKNFLSFEDQIRNWRFIIDIEGAGYSGRLKLLLSSPRVVLIQKRPFEEFFFPELTPWVHFVPVERDFSDLNHNLKILRENPSLEASIIQSARDFADRRLTRQAAVTRWALMLEKRSREGQLASE